MKSISAKKLVFGIFIVPISFLITSSVKQDDSKENPDPSVQHELESFHVAEGLEVSLFAAEPLVIKPIQMNWDAEGRLWVVSSTAYPHLKTGEQANDKIFILEDTDGDGKADKSTIFAEGLLTPTGILPGDGGVYVANSTEILHFMDTDGDGKADKRRQVLTGFGTADTHHLIHTFRWGPEGRLYFNQSIYIYSHVETPFGVKRLEGGGVWQLHPKSLQLDIYARGLLNPWGLQFDRWGQSFLTDGAGGEGINYAFPGATFVTAPGAERIIRGLNPGQPKHSGVEVISGRHFPESWAGSVVSNDFRANRINRFKLEEQGSGYASKQMEDILWTDHVAFRPVDISQGPDGAIYVADWYNPIIQHGEVDFHDPRRDQQHGRIWRIVAKNRPLVKKPELRKATVNDLLESLKLPEDWTRGQAKQVLKARGVKEVIPALEKWVVQLDKKDVNYEHHLLEALWLYQTMDVVNEPILLNLLNAESHKARAAALRALGLWNGKVTNTSALLAKACTDKHPQVRLEAVIGLRKVKTAEAAGTALSVLDQPMDEFLDFALWQTIGELSPFWIKRMKAEPDYLGNVKKTVFALKSVHNPEAVSMLVDRYKAGQVPDEYQKDVLGVITKSGKVSDLNVIFQMALANNTKNAGITSTQLNALEDAARQRNLKPDVTPDRIAEFIGNEDENIALSAIRLIGYWRLEHFSERLISLTQMGDKNLKKAALGAITAMNKEKAEPLLIAMTGKKNAFDLRLLATAQLVSINPAEAARIAADLFQNITEPAEAREVFQAFFTKQGTKPLAEALLNKKIPANLAKLGRQTVQQRIPPNRLKDDDVKLLIQALEASGGKLAAERMPQDLSDQTITNIAKDIKTTADAARGEIIFRKTSLNCQTCHAIGGAGGRVGPDLSSLGTSSPVETIIRSVLYPSLSVKEGFELKHVVKKDGTELMGYLTSDGASDIVMRDVTGKELSVSKSQVQVLEKVPGSLMPPGLTADLDKQEFIDLIGFLSRLGESGKYRVPTARFIRRWEIASANKELAKKISEEGPGYVVKDHVKISFQPLYSKVSGEIPLEELPVVETSKNYSFLKFEIEVLTKGNVSLAMNSTQGITAWIGQKQVKLTDGGLVADLSPGIQKITLAIDRSVFKNTSLRIELKDSETGPAQTRLVIGR